MTMKSIINLFLVPLLMAPSFQVSRSAGLPAPAVTQAVKFDDEELLDWSPGRRLTWDDYKASPRHEGDVAASTTTYLAIEYKIGTNSFSYKIHSRFSKTRSWGLYKTDYILSHEQGHFDIAEVYARVLNKSMSEYTFNRRTYQRDLQDIYDEVTDAKEEMQNAYDDQTNHSINKEQQAIWLKRIASMLREYDEWADY
jgi:predicted secreted Zn-dependent protease